MEMLIVITVFVATTAGALALIQAQMSARITAQARLDRIAMRGEYLDLSRSTALRGNRMSSISWLQPVLADLDLAKALDLLLIRADWKMRVSEFLALCLLGAGLGFAVGQLLLGVLLVSLGLALLGAYVPYLMLKLAAKRRIAKIEKQLVEMLVMMSNALRAGFALMQAVDQCAKQLPSPIADELRLWRQETQVGSTVEDAVLEMNRRIGSLDLDIVVTAILVQRTVGGNLSEILDNVAHTIRERDRIRGEIQTLIAEQKMTGIVVTIVPPVVGVIFFFINHDYMMLLFTEPLGRLMLGIALTMEVIGAWMIRKIINIDV